MVYLFVTMLLQETIIIIKDFLFINNNLFNNYYTKIIETSDYI